MLKENELQSGDYVKAVPAGIVCKLRYTDHGVLSSVEMLDSLCAEEGQPMELELVTVLQKAEVFPTRISTFKRATTITGVIKPDSIPFVRGRYPYASYDAMLDMIKNCSIISNLGMSFVAIEMESEDPVLGIYNMNRHMEFAGFTTLKGISVSSEMNQNKLDKLLDQYGYPFVAGYRIYRNLETTSIDSNIVADVVLDVDMFTRDTGSVFATVSFESLKIDVPYSKVVRFNLQRDSKVLLDDNGAIVYSSSRDNPVFKDVPNEICCEFCDAKIRVSSSGDTKCKDENCISRQYPIVVRLLRAADLPEMSFEEFKMLSKSGKLYSILDLFDLDAYSNIDKVSMPLSTLLDAICPIFVRRVPEFFQRFAQATGSVPTAVHYIENPEKILDDLKLDIISVNNIVDWLSNPETALTVISMINHDKIDIEFAKPVIENVPQFLNKQVIYLMGNFLNGSYEDIVNILTSYGAEITDRIDNRCTWVILGSVGHNMDDNVVMLAQAYHIPIYDEVEFFSAYKIDKDIEKSKSERM